MANKLIPGVNDLETLYPEVAAQWDNEKNEAVLKEHLRTPYKL